MYSEPTIAAIATPPGSGGIAIVRVSGDDAPGIAQKVFTKDLRDHQMTYGHIVDAQGDALDEAMAVLMLAPHSYTREHVLELHSHGGSYIAQRILQRCIEAGASPAKPGEFTKRAFLNGRLDLTQAQAVMDIIAAESDAAMRAALTRLNGGFAKEVHRIEDRLLDEAARLEALLDYPDEDLEDLAVEETLNTLRSIDQQLVTALEGAHTGRKIRKGIQVAIIGPPNAGKSSLLNALLQEERAIVTEVAGTTRDTLQEPMEIGGHLFLLTDTAGIRDSDDPVEKIGVQRARKAIDEADILLLCVDQQLPPSKDMIGYAEDPRAILLLNKDDLPHGQDGWNPTDSIRISAIRGDNLDAVKQALLEKAQLTTPSDLLLTHEGDVLAIREAECSLKTAISALEEGLIDVAATEIHSSFQWMRSLTQSDEEEMLNRMFAQFCLGK